MHQEASLGVCVCARTFKFLPKILGVCSFQLCLAAHLPRGHFWNSENLGSLSSLSGRKRKNTHTHTDDAAESSVWRKRTTLFSRGFCQKVTLGEGTEAAVEPPPSPPPIVPTQKARVKPAKAGQGGQKWLGHDCPPGPKSTATTGCERGGGEGI